jgi:hypothetical protein
MIGIAIARYSERENGVKERNVKKAQTWDNDIDNYFRVNSKHPIYGYYTSEDFCGEIAITTAYRKEYNKIKD